MRTKQLVIQEAWGKYWEAAKDYINEYGWISYKGMCNVFGDGKHPHLYFYEEIQEELDLESYDDQILMKRPKSLSGIDDNRGWTRIESEKDYPAPGQYWAIDQDGDMFFTDMEMFEGIFDWSGIEYYQRVNKPKPPLY